MDVLSRYTFISAYNTDQMSRREAISAGVSATDFTKCDTDDDGVITIEEILANDDVCQEILNAIAAQSAETVEMQTPPEEAAAGNPEIAKETQPADETGEPPFAPPLGETGYNIFDRQFNIAA